MTPEQSQIFATNLRAARDAAGLTLRGLSELTGINNGLLSRIESGVIQNPNAEKLTRIAQALNIPLADVYAWANYTVPSQLPSPGPYFRTKFRDVPEDVMATLTEEVTALLAKHGISASDGHGPEPGEDERDEAVAVQSESATKSAQAKGAVQEAKKPTKTKGGK